MEDYIKKIEKNIATINIFDRICDKIFNYKYNNIYTNEIHTLLKIHTGQCMYKYVHQKNIDDDAFYNIIEIIRQICYDYTISIYDLCKIFNLLGFYSQYDQIGTVDYILGCILLLNDTYSYELNYELLNNHELKLFLEFHNEMATAISFNEKIDILVDYFYHTDLRDSFLQAYATSIIEMMHKKLEKNNINHIRYHNHLIQHASNMLLLNLVKLDNIYNFIFEQTYDMFPNCIDYYAFKEYEYEYCIKNNINYLDYVTDYYKNIPIQLK